MRLLGASAIRGAMSPTKKRSMIHDPRSPKRIKSFLAYYRNYTSTLSVLPGLAPLPLNIFGLFPTYDVHRWQLAVMTAFICVIMMALVLHFRDKLVQVIDAIEANGRQTTHALPFRRLALLALPVLPAIVGAASAVTYQSWMTDSVAVARTSIAAESAANVSEFARQHWLVLTSDAPRQETLEAMKEFRTRWPVETELSEIEVRKVILSPPFAMSLKVWYVLTFVSAELALSLMALWEYYREPRLS
jgi:hypothetical protein